MLSKEDSKAIILFSIAKRMLEAPKGNKSATAKKISEESFYDPVTNNYLSFSPGREIAFHSINAPIRQYTQINILQTDWIVRDLKKK